jgi:phospholipase/carboxylesterase
VVGSESAAPEESMARTTRRTRRGPGEGPHGEGRLEARPTAASAGGLPGIQPLNLGLGRDGLLYVPDAYRHDRPAPLVLLLHGAGGDGADVLSVLHLPARGAGMLVLAPDSRAETWDVIRGGYGPDVAFIDRALAQTFTRYAVDAAHVAVSGFSDGASYALSLGITNGDWLTHVIAFSPGFMAPAAQRGAPEMFLTHGVGDRVLPIDSCSRRIVPRLRHAGYAVRYEEFDGGHVVPPSLAREATDWFMVA